jgi:hypothetical protein
MARRIEGTSAVFPDRDPMVGPAGSRQKQLVAGRPDMKTIAILAFGAALIVSGAASAHPQHMMSHSDNTVAGMNDGKSDNDHGLLKEDAKRLAERGVHEIKELLHRRVELRELVVRLVEDLKLHKGNPARIIEKIARLEQQIKKIDQEAMLGKSGDTVSYEQVSQTP